MIILAIMGAILAYLLYVFVISLGELDKKALLNRLASSPLGTQLSLEEIALLIKGSRRATARGWMLKRYPGLDKVRRETKVSEIAAALDRMAARLKAVRQNINNSNRKENGMKESTEQILTFLAPAIMIVAAVLAVIFAVNYGQPVDSVVRGVTMHSIQAVSQVYGVYDDSQSTDSKSSVPEVKKFGDDDAATTIINSGVAFNPAL